MATLRFHTRYLHPAGEGKTVEYRAGHLYRDVPDDVARAAMDAGKARHAGGTVKPKRRRRSRARRAS